MALGRKTSTRVGVALIWSPLAQRFRARGSKSDSFGFKSQLCHFIPVALVKFLKLTRPQFPRL